MAELTNLVPPGSVLTSDEDLQVRSRDWWPVSRLKEIRGDQMVKPAAVVLPTTTQQVADVLRWANRAGVSIVPRGLGSGVCGAVLPQEESVVLELSSMDRVLATDLVSQVVHTEAGIRGDRLEQQLEAHDLTLGHYPQSINLSTVGGWISAWSSGQASPGYGSIEHRLLGLTFVLADGTVVRLPPSPRPASGPDLRRLMLGAEGTLGVVTEAWLACAPRDPEITWHAVQYPSFKVCLDATRSICRLGLGHRVIRGWDEADSTRAFGAKGIRSGSVGLIGIPSSAPGLTQRISAAADMALTFGAVEIDPSIGQHWWAHRLDAVEIFESILGPARVLGPGSMIDTIEVSALWANLHPLYLAVRTAFLTSGVEIRGHFSHVYSSGAALYFTFIVREADDDAAERRHSVAWSAALAACQGSGGFASHHHGLGHAKAGVLEGEIGTSGVELLRRVKAALDPIGILNPGNLIDSSRPAV
jgi:alkyldihydroxyacetonephosphate synthase